MKGLLLKNYCFEFTKCTKNVDSLYFNIFYIVCFGNLFDDKKNTKKKFQKLGEYLLEAPENFVDRNIDIVKKNAKNYSKKLKKFFSIFKISKEVQSLIFEIVSAILLLQNLKIEQISESKIKITKEKYKIEGENNELVSITNVELISRQTNSKLKI